MTREEARNKAQTRVWCCMNKDDIDYYFDEYKLTVLGKNGKKKAKPNRAEKKHALIEYITNELTTEDDSKAERQQKAYEERCKHDVAMITGKTI